MTHWSEEIRAAAYGDDQNFLRGNAVALHEVLLVLLGIEQNHIGQPACEPVHHPEEPCLRVPRREAPAVMHLGVVQGEKGVKDNAKVNLKEEKA